jgi:hypothetical protein
MRISKKTLQNFFNAASPRYIAIASLFFAPAPLLQELIFKTDAMRR